MPLYKRMKRSMAGEDPDEPEEEEEPEEEGEEEEPAAAPAPAVAAPGSAEQVAALRSIVPVVPASWAERLQVTASKALRDQDFNPDDDHLREELFERQSIAGVNAAIHLLKQHGIPFKRPADFYAEMVKSDVHMARVRQNLESEREKILRAQQRRAQRHNKKFGRQVQAQVTQERERQKQDALNKVSALRKKLKAQKGDADADIDVAFGGDDDADRPTRGGGAGHKRKRSLTPGGHGAKRGRVDVPGAQRKKKGPGGKRPGKNKRRR
eukprot:TRINITY_DN13408_c0_g2_i2.p1 TRINITY_DN13408_c0_g2~~TRINITY_DN13408_c0_g2_i2.p1  ORF type:complete len:300 (+),score=128.86 TRINITY_DN13408_c0_g2_i2:101-901(+)